MIKWFDSKKMAGLPEVTNTQGDLIKMLTGLLVNGVNTKPITSIVYADGVCTLTLGVGHGFITNSIITIKGSTQPSLIDKEFRLTKTDSTSISFKSAAAVSSETDVSVALAPLGFESFFTSEGKACFKSKDPRYPAYLRVDDTKLPSMSATSAKFARVEICEGMTDFDTATWQSPYDPLIPTKNREDTANSNGWFKWYYSAARNSTPDITAISNSIHHYILIGDDTNFWLVINPYLDVPVGVNQSAVYGFVLADYGSEVKQVLIATDGSGLAGASKSAPTESFIANHIKLNIAPLREVLSTTAFAMIAQANTSGGNSSAIALAAITASSGTLIKRPVYIVDNGKAQATFHGVGVVSSKYAQLSLANNNLNMFVDVGQSWFLVFDLGAI